MRFRIRFVATSCGAIMMLATGLASVAHAQGADAEVRRAVERAVGLSLSSSIAESTSRSIVSEGLHVAPTSTLFASPFYSRIEGDFLGTTFDADAGGVILGGLHKVHDIVLIHGAVAAAGASTELSSGGAEVAVDSRAVEMRVGVDIVYLNTDAVKAWLTLEGGASNFDAEGADDVWTWRAGPSTTASFRTGDILIEPTIRFAFADVIDSDVDSETATAFQVGNALKYRGKKWRPQFNFEYSKVIDPDIGDDGFISVGPEILYAATPTILVGGAYSYGTSLTSGLNVDAHTLTAELRWTF